MIKNILGPGLLTLSLTLVMPTFSHAQLSGVLMDDADIKAFVSGNTLAAEDWGNESNEYHSPSGVAIWNNDGDVQTGRYQIKNGRVCYTYLGDSYGDWYCWDFKRDRRTGEIRQWSDDANAYTMQIVGDGDLVTGTGTELDESETLDT